jgi:predicted GH43/DUF377 family glycosyl hydrolase
MKVISIIFLFACSVFGSESLVSSDFLDFEDKASDFVLEVKKLTIPGFPNAFNPSIIRWGRNFLLNFRIIPNRSQSFTSYMGVVILDENFDPTSEPQLLDTRAPDASSPSRCEDGRLIYVGDTLYLVYSDNMEPKISKGGFRIYIAKLEFDGERFHLKDPECLTQYDGESRDLREKNWVPFDYRGNLFLGYSLVPHLIFRPLLMGTGACETISCTIGSFIWSWGILRGGTSALLGAAQNGEYLAFFHSSKKIASAHSDGQNVLHYFMGAYTFSAEPPFSITRVSSKPIIGKNFYNGPIYKPFWHPVRVVFPGGYVFDDRFIWIVYGRQDHEAWVAKLDRAKLLESLVPINSSFVR